ncbi:MAG: TrmO family methyltransferase, partial [Peptococcaceae bacterium]|nr:TrmO family methyltransferase [Peptococcaceae bacterium]
RLLRVEDTDDEGPVLIVDGADMMDGTPIYDIKPYLPFTDSHPNARAGFAEKVVDAQLAVDFPQPLLEKMPQYLRTGAVAMLAQNPIPHYQKNPDRIYGIAFGGYDIRFRVINDVATVEEVVEL